MTLLLKTSLNRFVRPVRAANADRSSSTTKATRSTRTLQGKAERKLWQLQRLREVSAMDADQAMRELGTLEGGLTTHEVELSRAAHGSNEVARGRRDSAPVRFLKAFLDPFTGILALLAVVSLVTDVVLASPQDRDASTVIIIFAMILVSGILRFVQEGKSGSAAEALAKTIQTTCCVERADEGIASVSKLLLRLMVVMAPMVFVINGITKGDWLSALLFSLSVAVGLTPEMLPMIVTTCLAKGATDLSRDRVIVKHLDSIQNLGAMDVLCTDKTGTLTEDHVVLERHLNLMGKAIRGFWPMRS